MRGADVRRAQAPTPACRRPSCTCKRIVESGLALLKSLLTSAISSAFTHARHIPSHPAHRTVGESAAEAAPTNAIEAIIDTPNAPLRVVEDNLHIRAAKLFTMLLLPRPLPAPRSACAARILAHLVPFTRACACLVSLPDGRCRSRSSPAIPFSTFRTRRAEDASIAFSGRAR